MNEGGQKVYGQVIDRVITDVLQGPENSSLPGTGIAGYDE
jgi:hypothetical protein